MGTLLWEYPCVADARCRSFDLTSGMLSSMNPREEIKELSLSKE